MSAQRKHSEVNERVMQAHERKELKEEQQRLINLQNRSKSHASKRRKTTFSDVYAADHSFQFAA
jgi:hypothetical protein